MRRHVHAGRSSADLIDADRVLKNINPSSSGTLLDAGAGDGFLSFAASHFVSRVIALDDDVPSVEIIEKGIRKRKLNNVFAVVADLTKRLPFVNRAFDTIVMANVLHGLVANSEVDASLSELKRVMNDEGKFAVIEFKKNEEGPGPPIDVKLSPEQTERVLEKHGFMRTNAFDAGEYHYALVFAKKNSI